MEGKQTITKYKVYSKFSPVKSIIVKKHINKIILIANFVGFIGACNKSDNAVPNVNASSIKDKTWSGSLTYSGKTTEYYSVRFNGDNTLLWAELSGDYTGHWTISGKKITMNFDSRAEKISADISENNELLNITNNSGTYEVYSGALVANSNLSLDNTIWKGAETNTNTSATKKIQLNFKSGNLVECILDTTILGTFSYSRNAGGAAIHIGDHFFGVILPSAEMRGSDGRADFPWHAIKQ